MTHQSTQKNIHISFFSGIGGVSEGLSDRWETTWANDNCPSKVAIHQANHNSFIDSRSIYDVPLKSIPDGQLLSSTFPCTNTSAAGNRRGLLGIKSSVVYRYLEILKEKGGADTIPSTFIENPTGLIARNQGNDLRDIVRRFNDLGYAVTTIVVDAKHFVPQSRPRLFVIAIKDSNSYVPLYSAVKDGLLNDKAKYPNPLRRWLKKNSDLNLVIRPTDDLPERTIQLTDVIDLSGGECAPEFTAELIRLMAPKNTALFHKLIQSPSISIATVARRGRKDVQGKSFNATELSVSGLAPCQRPYSGGSSRTWVLVAGQGKCKFKVVTPRESARLMGFPDSFQLPQSAKAAYTATGDAVVPACISWIESQFFSDQLGQESIKIHQEMSAQLELIS